MSVAITALCGRTSDSSAGPAAGAAALAEALGCRLAATVVQVGEPTDPRSQAYDLDLRDGREVLRAAGDTLARGLAGAQPTVLTAGECSIAVGTLPALARTRGDAQLLWLDAHGDFNTPETTGSGYLGGMCLAGACGLWDTGLAPAIGAGQVVLAGIRDLDPGERELLEAGPAVVLGPSDADLAAVPGALGDAPVFVHLDLDILDPEVWPCTQVPAAGGIDATALADLLAAVAAGRPVLGIEITGFDAPGDIAEREGSADRAAAAVGSLFP